jgi:anti-anti-sigma regulatory factor
VLIGAHRRATSLGITLRLAAPRFQATTVLHATGLDRSLSIHPTLADALAQPPIRRPATAGPSMPRP